jgi:hypothetical protein
VERYFSKKYFKNNKNNNNNIVFYLGSLKMELPKKSILIVFILSKLVEDYHLLIPSKPLDGAKIGE